MLDLGRIPSLGAALRDATISFKIRTALIEADRPMSEALLAISQKGFGVVGVTEAGAKVGSGICWR